MSTNAPSTAAEAPSLPGWLVALLAVACGATVANLYYAQPLLNTIADDLGVAPDSAALIVTASQIGYAIGLLFIVPLGDLLDRRRMVSRMLVVTAVALAGAAVAPSLALLGVAIAVVGITSVVAQILVPMASSLAPESERGRVVGVVMSGLLIGILTARTFSGILAGVLSWRAVFWIAAGGMIALSAALHHALPGGRVGTATSYGRLLASVGALVRDEPLLRRRMVYGAAGMGGFSVLWTSLALLLAKPPFDYGETVIGLFGLAGLAGAGAAQVAGRLSDRGYGHPATGTFLVAIVAGWALLLAGRHSVPLILAGIVILDLGVQGQHIVNQNTIYGLAPETRSRVTTAYMTGNFLTGALCSAASAWAWHAGGWTAVCALGGGIAVAALLFWVYEHARAPAREAVAEAS